MYIVTSTLGVPPKKQNARYNQSNIEIYGDWLNSLEWNFYCTFTTRYQLSIPAARRLMNNLLKIIQERYNCSPRIFWVAEPFDTKYGYHLHALIFTENILAISINELKKCWQIISKGRGQKEYNNTTIKEYIKSKGAHYYVSKYLQRENVDYDILFY